MRDSMPLFQIPHTQIHSKTIHNHTPFLHYPTLQPLSLTRSLKELLLGAIDERKRVSASKGQRPHHSDYLTLTLLLHSDNTEALTLLLL